ncbi:BIIDXI-like protein At5g11420 isoform X2 [Silene latifolia]|uniref:BIIDXI-like protein At5g11420 isoform X2 n=1 Tax=Silene latifolia TaxID=37657 RepID=UPI003D7702DD
MKATVIFVLYLASTFCVSFGGMLPNGDFEISPSPTRLSGTKVEGANAIPKWETNGYVEYITVGAQQGDMVLVVPEGKHAVKLGNDASIRQKVEASKGAFYALTFSFARTCSQEETLLVSISPNHERDDSGVLPLQTIYNNLGYDNYAWGFLAEADVIEITLHNVGKSGEDVTCGPVIDTVALTILDPVRPTGGNLVKNGDFGEGPYVFHTSPTGVLIPPNVEDDHSPLPGWMIESQKAVKYIDSLHFYVPQGQRAVELIGGQESSIAQTIRTNPGETYVLTFLIGDAKNYCVGDLAIEAFAGKKTTKVPYKSYGKGGLTKGQLFFTADKDRTRIRFLSSYYTMTTQGSLCGPVLDDVKVLTARYHKRIHT